MSSLTGTKIKDSYPSLLKVIDNGGLGASAKQITDGLGTGSPLSLSTSEAKIDGLLNLNTGGVLQFGANTSTPSIGAGIHRPANYTLAFVTATTEAMRITSGGDVFIGSATPTAPSEAGIGLYAGASNGIPQLTVNKTYSGSTYAAKFYHNGTVIGSIGVSNTATSYNTSSDYRLKEDWQPMADALTRIDALKPVNFAWKSDGSRVDGFLAHELQEVIPEAVTGVKDGMREEEYEVSPAVYEEVVHPAEEAVYETIEHPAIAEELDADGNIIVEAQEAWTEEVLVSEAKEEWTEQVLVSEAVMGTREVPDYQGIDQSKIVPLLVGAIQELKAEIEALKAV